MLVGFGVAARWAIRKETLNTRDDFPGFGVAGIVFGGIAVIGAIIYFVSLSNMIAAVARPDAAYVMRILDGVKR